MQFGHASSANDHFISAWNDALTIIREEVDPQVFSAYFSPLSFAAFRDTEREFVIEAPSKFLCSYLEKAYASKLEATLARITLVENLRVSFRVREVAEGQDGNSRSTPRYVVVKKIQESVKSPELIPIATSNSSSGQTTNPDKTASGAANGEPTTVGNDNSLASGPLTSVSLVNLTLGESSLNSRYTFDTFVVGNSNQFCHAAAMRVAEKPGHSYNPLFIYGGVGLGKTHLLHSIGNEVIRNNPNAKVIYLSSEAFTNELILALRNARMEEFKRKFRAIDVLLIDDIQFISGKERTQEEFFHTFNALYNAKHQIVITSDKIPSEIFGIEERLQTRFSWGLTADLQSPDFETRVAILKRKASLEGFSLPEGVAHLIAERVSSNVRELEGALTRLHAMCSIRGIPMTVESAASAIQPLLVSRTVNISCDDIKKAVATHFGIKVVDMVSKRRTKNLSFPRHIAMYLCRKHTTCSYPEIGQQFGGRDHSSVIHAAHVVSGKIPTDGKVKLLIEEIERNLLQD